jgi:sigma-E factor negative regulatory protein RseC
MIEEQAIVTGTDGDMAIIQMQRHNACSGCELNNGCGTGAIGRLLGHRSKPLSIRNRDNLKSGDRVVLGMPDKAFLKASLLIYGLPLAGLMSAGMISQWLFADSEIYVVIFSAVGFIAGLASSGQIAKKRFSRQFNPKILKVVGEPKV